MIGGKAFAGAPNPANNTLGATSGANVLSPGGVTLGPGPDDAVENDDLTLEFATPVSAFGFDHLAQSADGFSFTGGGPNFPKIPDGQKPRWSKDGKTVTLPISLQLGKKYQLGLNSYSHKNFSSKSGVPLEPVDFTFATAGR